MAYHNLIEITFTFLNQIFIPSHTWFWIKLDAYCTLLLDWWPEKHILVLTQMVLLSVLELTLVMSIGQSDQKFCNWDRNYDRPHSTKAARKGSLVETRSWLAEILISRWWRCCSDQIALFGLLEVSLSLLVATKADFQKGVRSMSALWPEK